MRIAIVHSFYQSSLPSGENIAVQLQADALRHAGHEVATFGRNTDDFLGSVAYPIRAGLTVATGKGPSPLDEIRLFDPDVVHIHNLFPNWSEEWINELEYPFVVTLHNFRLICPAGTLLRDGKYCDLCPTRGSHHSVVHACYRDSRLATLPLAVRQGLRRKPLLLERAHSIVFLSERSKAIFDSYGLGFPEKAHVVPNFVLSPSIRPTRAEPFVSRRWAFVGRLSEEKGILQALEHWPNDVGLDIIGSGPLGPKCKEVSRKKDVAFLGHKERRDVLDLLGTAEGLLFPSVWPEGAATLVFLEAISLGLPVLAKGGNAVADDLSISGAGIVFEEFAEIPEALEIMAQSNLLFRTAALDRFEDTYSMPKWISSIEQTYATLRSN